MKPSGPKTEIIEWRGGKIEFCRSEGQGFNSTQTAQPPWYVIHIRGGYWDKTGWYLWNDYGGPPIVFLTRKEAELEAKRFRKQYWGASSERCPRLKVTVKKIKI